MKKEKKSPSSQRLEPPAYGLSGKHTTIGPFIPAIREATFEYLYNFISQGIWVTMGGLLRFQFFSN